MRVAVVDIGSNSARLLVAERTGAGVGTLRKEKAYLGLGAEIVRAGAIGAPKLAEAAETAARYARIARKLRAERLDVLVTAPGRQATNADELLHVLAQAVRAPVRVLSAEDEGALAFAGAVGAESRLVGAVAVVDVGGGSTEIAIGDAAGQPEWLRSVELGSLRLTARTIASDPPTADELALAEREVEEAFAELRPPRVDAALAVGGSARGLARIVGRTLGADELEAALTILAARGSGRVARTFRVDRERARVLPAGALVLARVTRLLDAPLQLARAGLREGAASVLLAEEAAA
jgi:exopolyphosphatase/guanosine-5'-triphosphate,3'-diphosphate pyrophosphatase